MDGDGGGDDYGGGYDSGAGNDDDPGDGDDDSGGRDYGPHSCCHGDYIPSKLYVHLICMSSLSGEVFSDGECFQRVKQWNGWKDVDAPIASGRSQGGHDQEHRSRAGERSKVCFVV